MDGVQKRAYHPLDQDQTHLDLPDYFPKENKAVEFAKKVIRTVLTVGLFIFICKLTHFREKVLHDVRIDRKFLAVFYFTSISYVVIYIYLLITLRWIRPENKRIPVDFWDRYSPKMFYTSVVCLVLSVLSFIFAMWRTFQLMTFPIGFLGLLSLIFILQWFPF